MKLRNKMLGAASAAALAIGVFAGPAAAATGSHGDTCWWNILLLQGSSARAYWSDTSTSITTTKVAYASSAASQVSTWSAKMFDNTGAVYGDTGVMSGGSGFDGAVFVNWAYAPKSKKPYTRIILHSGTDVCTYRLSLP